MTTIATVFSGGEGVGTGARAAGMTHLWGVEYDPKIAAVAERNGFKSIVADFLTVDPSGLEVPDIFHASPVCKNASIANNKRGETQWDIDCGQHVAHFIDVLQPKIVTIENVWQYRDFEAFERIKAALERGGYMFDWYNVNAADFSVPQTRRRLIMRAMKGWLPVLPPPERWVGWYEAIADLIPTLPESKFAPWQLARLPEELANSIYFGNTYQDEVKGIPPALPSSTLVTQNAGGMPRAFILAGAGNTNLADAEPGRGVPNAAQPVQTIGGDGGGRTPRAFITDSLNYNSERPNRFADEPIFTQTIYSSKHPAPRAFIMPGANSSNESPARSSDEPIGTLTSQAKQVMTTRAWLSAGRVVRMTPRALARFQSFPDSYVLPDKVSLACTVIGNSVPPLLYQKIIAQLIAALA